MLNDMFAMLKASRD